MTPAEIAARLSPESRARLLSMKEKGFCWAHEIEPQLPRSGLVTAKVRHQEGTHWELTDSGRKVAALIADEGERR